MEAQDVVAEVVDAAQTIISDDELRREFYKKIMRKFHNYDPELVDEAIGIDDIFDEVYEETITAARGDAGHDDGTEDEDETDDYSGRKDDYEQDF
jgi:hypothetical protein